MVVGREAELAGIDAALELAAGGSAQVMALVGEPGLGKTTLLSSAAAAATGFQILRVTGAQSEAGLGYAALASLLRSSRPHLDALPARQRRAADACLAEGDDEVVDLLALGSALITLLGELAATQPVLLLVDDVQWVDPESRRAIAFALRRLSSERVCALLAARTQDALPDGIPATVVLSRLADSDAGEVVGSLGLGLDELDVADVVARGAGNPLAVVELARRTAQGGPAAGPLGSVHDAYTAEVAALSPAARDALLLSVCDGRVDLALVASVVLSTTGGTGPVDELVASGLLVASGAQASLRHPLLATAVLAGADPAEARRAHSRLSDALAPYDEARSLKHRASATVGQDEALAALVADSGLRASRAGRPAEATASLELAAALTLEPGLRCAWLAAAAEAAVVSADAGTALTLASRCRALGPESAQVRARLDILEGLVALRQEWRTDVAASVVAACAVVDAGTAAPVLRRVATAALIGRDDTVTRAAVDLLDSSDSTAQPFVDVVRDLAALGFGGPGSQPVDPSHVDSLLDRPPPHGDVATALAVAGVALEWGRLGRARELYLGAEPAARASGDVEDIATVTVGVAFCDHNLGRWTASYARAWEVSALLRDVDVVEQRIDVLMMLAEVQAGRGQSDGLRSTCAEIRAVAGRVSDTRSLLLADRREALLDLGLGRLDAAIARLESALWSARFHGIDHPYVSPVPDLVEAYVRAGRTAEARAVAPDFADRVGPSSPPLPRARALRLAGLLSDGPSYDEAFTESVRIDLEVGQLFQAARTLLCHGERLRRDGRRVDARARLHSALDAFQRLEAAPWVARCESELAASGATVAEQRAEDVSAVLTPQELQVAVLVAEGRRNRDIAESLFLSQRTVESHLSRIFRKLGVDSRTQLTLRMTQGAR